MEIGEYVISVDDHFFQSKFYTSPIPGQIMPPYRMETLVFLFFLTLQGAKL